MSWSSEPASAFSIQIRIRLRDRSWASAERVQRLPGVVLGNDLTLEVGAVAAVSGHRPSS
jgi:hypothetical protein